MVGSRIRRLSSVGITSVLVAGTMIEVAASAVESQLLSSVIALDCGYSVVANTMRPTATVARFGTDTGELRVGVGLFLFDGPTQVGAGLGTGEVGSPANGTVEVPVGETRQLQPNAGAVFGDGGLGGGPLIPEHSYEVRTRLLDFDNLDVAEFKSWECRTGTPPGLDTDGDGFGDAIEDAYVSDRLDNASTPVVPPGAIQDPLGSPPGINCGPEAVGLVVVDTCALRPGDVILERHTSDVSRAISFYGASHFTHSLLVIGRFDTSQGLGGDGKLEVIVADITLNRRTADGTRAELALGDFRVLVGDPLPDALGIYRPVGLERVEREAAAREALGSLEANGAYDLQNHTALDPVGFGWAAPQAEYTISDPQAFGPNSFYCSTFVADAYLAHFQDPSQHYWWPSGWFVTPDDLIGGLPGMTLLYGYNTDGGTVTVWSPAHVLLIDPDGRRTGMDSTGAVHDEIPGARWVLTKKNEGVSAPGLAPNWVVNVTGFDAGTYVLVFQALGATASPAVGVSGYTRVGQSETFQVGDLPGLVGRPVAVDDSVSTRVGIPVTINVVANDSDPNGDSLAVTDVTDPPNGTAINNSDGTVTYRSDCETQGGPFTGIDTFAYTISDGTGGSATAMVSVRVRKTSRRDPAGC